MEMYIESIIWTCLKSRDKREGQPDSIMSTLLEELRAFASCILPVQSGSLNGLDAMHLSSQCGHFTGMITWRLGGKITSFIICLHSLFFYFFYSPLLLKKICEKRGSI
jgi:hypothetical protein